MKILVLSHMFPPDVLGGYEIGCKQAVDGLLARGHDVRVLTSTPRSPLTSPDAPHVLRRFQLNDIWYNATRPRSVPAVNKVWEVDANWFSAHNTHALIQEVEAFRPDVVYAWMLLGVGGLGLMAGLQYLGVPWVVHLMDELPTLLCSSNWEVVPPMARAYGRFLSGRYLACSRAMVARIEAKGIDLAGQFELVPNWVVGAAPPPRPPRDPSRPFRVVSAGRITREKGIDLLIEAAQLLRDRGLPDVAIDIYGRVVDPSLPDLARRLGVEDSVRFRGFVEQSELAARFDEADLFAFPTEPREPFGFAPLEAASRGCVPLLPLVSGIGEWLVHGVHCLKVARTARGFADGIAAAARGEVDTATIARRVQRVVWRDFHRDSVMPRIEATLSDAAGTARQAIGTAEDAYRMALIAERLAHAIVQEPFHA